MITMLKDLKGPWERVRQGLLTDLEHLEAAINTRFAAVFNAVGVVNVPAGGTGAATLPVHGILVGEGVNPIVGVIGAGVVHASVTADPTISPVVEADISLSDNTTQNVTSTKHGFVPKAPADATKFLNGAATPGYQSVKDSDLVFTDITTNDVSITKHGFCPKLPNDATKFFDGTGAFSSAGRAWTLLTSAAASGTSQDFIGLAGYSEIRVFFKQVTLAGSASLVQLRVSTDNGSTFLSASGDYVMVNGGGLETAKTVLDFQDAGNTFNATPHSGELLIEGFNLTAPKVAKTNFFNEAIGLRYIPVASVLNAVRVLTSAGGSMNGGTIYIFGR